MKNRREKKKKKKQQPKKKKKNSVCVCAHSAVTATGLLTCHEDHAENAG